MDEKFGLRHRIAAEFAGGLKLAGELSAPRPEAEDDCDEMLISPELAADFELGLESELGSGCGCGCGHSCSTDSLENSSAACSGCHNHG